MSVKEIIIYTDGSSKGNPGPGGWGVLLRYGDVEKTFNGAERDTTNNRMELMAAIMGLRQLKYGCEVTVVTDSQYVKNGITTWLHNWKKNNWRTSDRKPVKNQDLWEQLEQSMRRQLGKGKPRWQIPALVFQLAKNIPMASGMIEKLSRSALFSSDKIESELGWRPTQTFNDVLPEMVDDYRLSAE